MSLKCGLHAMPYRILFRLFLGLLVAFSAQRPEVSAAEELPSGIHIATPVWEGQTQRDGTGFFFEMIRKIYEPRGIRVTWEFANWDRSLDLVKKGYADAMPSVWREDADAAGLKTPRLPLYLEYTAAVFKKSTFPAWEGVASLQGRSVVWFKGYDYHLRTPLAGLSMKWMEIPSEGKPWRMLAADRADALIDARIDVDRYVEENLVDLAVFQVVPLWGQKAYLAFSDKGPATDRLMRIFDEGMAELFVSGELEKLHDQWAVQGFDARAWTESGEIIAPLSR
jgi:polar amino acid transport system substrate-binding protein